MEEPLLADDMSSESTGTNDEVDCLVCEACSYPIAIQVQCTCTI